MGGNLLQSLPELRYHPEKGLNINIDPTMLQQLLSSFGGGQQTGMPQQMGRQPIIPPTQQGMPPQQQRLMPPTMGGMS